MVRLFLLDHSDGDGVRLVDKRNQLIDQMVIRDLIISDLNFISVRNTVKTNSSVDGSGFLVLHFEANDPRFVANVHLTCTCSIFSSFFHFS